MEEIERMKGYEYKATASLVLTTSDRKRDTGPSSEVTSLSGKVQTGQMSKQFGDRAAFTRPSDDASKQKKRERERLLAGDRADDENKKRGKSVLSSDVDNVYRPQTRETKAAYDVLLNFLQQELPDKPHDVLRSAADEVLSVLKDDTLRDNAKKKEIEVMFRRREPMPTDRFSTLYNIGTRITDYKTEEQADAGIDQDLGVNVVFDDEEDDAEVHPIGAAEDDVNFVRDEADDDEGADANVSYAIESKDADVTMEPEPDKKELDARSIDAFWLQRQLATHYKDPLVAQKMSDEVFKVLSNTELDDRATENKLVLLLDYDKFDLIKLLLRNRVKIVYCTRLARAGTEEEKSAIEQEMGSDINARAVLSELRRTATTAERQLDLTQKVKREIGQLAKVGASSTEAAGDDVVMAGGSGKPIGSATPSADDAFWTKRSRTALDINSLKFDAGAHLMSNDKLHMPKNSEIINKKGYQEIHVPALKPRSLGENEKLVQIASLPEWMQGAFELKDGKKMKELNRVQSAVYETAVHSAENMLLCAPTGAGKTNVAVLTILREMALHRHDDGSFDLDAFKIVYVAPMKSLVQEVVQNLSGRFEKFGIQVKELSGDQQLTKQQISETQIIVTTPEKWDIITRKSGDRTYTQLVRLVIIDEIHLLHDTRGPVLESIVARTIRQIEATQEMIRLVGLSATLPNYQDVAFFLRVKLDKGLFFFDGSYRPVPLQQQYIGITHKKAFKRLELMNQILYEKVMDYAGKEQVLIFVHSRKETVLTARALRDMATEKDELGKFIKDDQARRALLSDYAADKVKNEGLKDVLPFGFAVHHAGMNRADRTLVEELFADGHIQVLVSTATLAWGVNLPAHTVIIKGTQVYSPEKGDWVELSPMDVMQMIGRAGRPQFDDYGVGIIITSQKEVHYYLSLLTQQLPVESQFMSQLVDNLNAEIVLGTVSNVREAVTWLGYTYLFVRMLKSPKLYGISDIEEDPELLQRRLDLIHSAALVLDKDNLIKYDRKTGNFQVTDLGRVASHYYISHTSMAAFNEYLKPNISDIELFRVFSLSSEFRYMTVREEEKLELAKLLDKVPIPIKESIEEPSAKVNVLLQAYISRLKLEGYALISDMVYVTQSAGRVMRALFEICLKRGWSAAAEKTLSLCKMITHRMWGAQSALRQFPRMPPDVVKRLEGKEFPWERLHDLDEAAIGELIRVPKMGPIIYKAVHQLPRLELQGLVQPITRAVLKVELTITADFVWDEKIHGRAEPFWIVVEDVDGDQILHYEYFILKQEYIKDDHQVSFTIPIHEPQPPQYFVRVMSDRWLGAESVLPISFRNLILPERFAPPTELLDLQALPVAELGNERYIKFFAGSFEFFNPIQTQVFNSIYKTDTNALVAAPTGSGKTVLAELAIMRMLSQKSDGRCVYVAPLPSLAKERFEDWSKRFGKLGIPVTSLTGDTNADLKLLRDGQIVIATPDQWDVMSRRWTTRKNVQTLSLFIADELHLIGGEVGPVLEVIVSRMRYIASQTGNPIRIVGLCTSVANSRDLADWIGATASTSYNFHPNVRPVPLEIRLQGFDINSHSARQLAMSKPCFLNIKRHSPDKPVIVFVPSRKEARTVAVDLMTMAAAEDSHDRFLHVEAKQLDPYLARIKNKILEQTLKVGIGFLHDGLTDKERVTVEQLFRAGAIQVVVAEQPMAWGMTLQAHLVVIMGTEYYEGREHRYVDLPITDVIQMMGRASRPQIDTNGKCTIFCHAPKKEFYKKFLFEPFPVESHLDHYLADHLNAEIVTKRVENVQDAIDYLTWTFFYRRITQNPNYYNLQGVSHRHISDHLSEIVDSTLKDLESSHCIAIEDETDLSPLNLGMIASYYYIRYTTVELFDSSLAAKMKLKGLLEILAAATEFGSVPVRHREDHLLKKLARHATIRLELESEATAAYGDPHVKTNILLQSHFSRTNLVAALVADQKKILPDAARLLQAMVDVLSSKGWLAPAITCMEMSQMISQGMWNQDSVLLQLPHITSQHVAALAEHKVETINDLLNMDDTDRDKVLGFPPAKMADIAAFCNSYPEIDMNHEVEDPDSITSGETMTINVQLRREGQEEEEDEEMDGGKKSNGKKEEKDDGAGVPIVYAPRFPQVRNEGWWLVVGEPSKNELLSIKRVTIKKQAQQVALTFQAPPAGKHKLTVSLMCDSYLGVDQEYEVEVTVKQGAKGDDDVDM